MLVDTINAEMKNVRTLRKRRAVSPVIATVILVAVTITVAVAVSYWMSGITGQYTSFEKVEIQSAIFTPDTLPSHWEIIISLKNTGTKTASLTHVFVNEENLPYALTAGFQASIDTANPLHIESGADDIITIRIDNNIAYTSLSSGTTINIKIHSASGMDYIKLVQLT